MFEGEFDNLIEKNPLPESLELTLTPEFLETGRIQHFESKIKRQKNIEDVVYRHTLLEKLNRYNSHINYGLLLSGTIIAVLGFYLVFNNIKLTIASKKKIIRTMQLVGATPAFVRGPFIVQGVVSGIIGAVLAFGLLKLLVFLLIISFGSVFVLLDATLFYLVLAGLFFGILGSLSAFGARF